MAPISDFILFIRNAFSDKISRIFNLLKTMRVLSSLLAITAATPAIEFCYWTGKGVVLWLD